ncbi:MAG: acetyl-CoA carboxylase biotin carboxyl carrier protein [Candidatus Cloacimonetes bacterium]|nr:acetyl-CoA carboxylase biotin carboxyl carrier protein [Candidatus Cloacimonadota bacterium]
MIGSKDKSIISVAHLRSIFEEMQKYDITKLVINRSGERYEVQRGKNIEETTVQTISKQEAESFAQVEKRPEKNVKEQIEIKEERKPEEKKIEDKNIVDIKTPIVGTFYRASSPDSDPFVDIGSRIKKGDTLCIVEAMKSMNEIESEVSGIINEILAENGKMVEYDQILFKIKVS